METWTNVCVVPCVSTTGDPITVIGQTRADHAGQSPVSARNRAVVQRFVLGNSAPVMPLDSDSFMLPDTYEI